MARSWLVAITFCCLSLGLAAVSLGQVTTVQLPALMSDFALNPETGDLATVDPNKHRAYLFSEAALNSAEAEPSGDVRVGETPVSITFKRYKDKRLFAVVCSQDSHMYLIDARDFKLVKKVPLENAGVSAVVASQNPDDPFVYYNFGGGHDSAAGAVDVRKMVDRGSVVDDSMDCAVSANGNIFYRRGPWSPSGFDALEMSTDFSAEKPSFLSIHDEHRSTPRYVPGPFNEYTAAGPAIYSADLNSLVASLKFSPECFFKSQPVVVGSSLGDSRRSSRSPKSGTLMAASYNTFSSLGGPVSLPAELFGDAVGLPRGTAGHADFKRVGLRRRSIADDKNERVIHGYRNYIALVPLSEFGLEGEPFMRVMISKTEATVAVENNITVRASDPTVSLSFDDLPDGAVKTKEGFRWKPEVQQVGVHELRITLSFGEVSRVQTIDLTVAHPSMQLPINPVGLALSEDGKSLVCWSGKGVDRYGRPIHRNPGEAEPIYRVASVPLEASKQSIEVKTIPYAVKQAVVFENRFAILPAQENTRVDVYDAHPLKRARTLISNSPLSQVSTRDGNLLLHHGNGIDVYDINTLQRLRTLGGPSNSSRSSGRPSLTFADGTMSEGMLVDFDSGKPKLLINPGQIPQLKGANRSLTNGQFLRIVKPPTNQVNRSMRAGNGMIQAAGPVKLACGLTVTLEKSLSQIRNGSSYKSKRQVQLVVSSPKVPTLERIPILNVTLSPQSGNVANNAFHGMKAVGDTTYISIADRIYRWQAEPPKAEATDPIKAPVKFHVEPVQSTFLLADESTKLTHKLIGGEGPYEYYWLSRLEGASMNDQTGEVTLDRAKIVEECEKLLLPSLARYDSDRATTQLRELAIGLMEGSTKILGRRPKGLVSAIPIHFKAIDDLGKVAEMQYFVLIELDYKQLSRKLTEMIGEREKQLAMNAAEKEPAVGVESQSGEQNAVDSALERRMQSLEAKVDLLIRQVSSLTKQLEAEKK
ncbi:MAG: hypothetical protein AAFU85_01305 [Planctomycetota bacterium]